MHTEREVSQAPFNLKIKVKPQCIVSSCYEVNLNISWKKLLNTFTSLISLAILMTLTDGCIGRLENQEQG